MITYQHYDDIACLRIAQVKNLIMDDDVLGFRRMQHRPGRRPCLDEQFWYLTTKPPRNHSNGSSTLEMHGHDIRDLDVREHSVQILMYGIPYPELVRFPGYTTSSLVESWRPAQKVEGCGGKIEACRVIDRHSTCRDLWGDLWHIYAWRTHAGGLRVDELTTFRYCYDSVCKRSKL